MICHLILLVSVAMPQRIVFACEASQNSGLYVASMDGKACRRLTRGPDWDREPAWSPDGRWISFCRMVKGNPDHPRSYIYLVKPDGTGLRQLTFGDNQDSEPEWTADSQKVVFNRSGKDYSTCSTSLDGKDIRQVKNQYFVQVHGNWAAVLKDTMGRGGLYVRGLWLENQITKESLRLSKFGQEIEGPTWSPDGKNLAFIDQHRFGGTVSIFNTIPKTSNRSKVKTKPSPPEFRAVLYSAAVPSGKLTTLDIGSIDEIQDPVYSPDGTKIAYLKSMKADEWNGAMFDQLWVMNSDGTHKRRLSNHRGQDFSPRWTRDSRRILIGSDCGSTLIGINGYYSTDDSCLRIIDPKTGRSRAVHFAAPITNFELSR